jgi:hypothetical protein
VRKLSASLDARDRPFSPERPGSWQGSSRDLVVNPRSYEIRRVHKIAPRDSDRETATLPDSAFSSKTALADALRKAGILSRGQRLREFRIEGDKVIAFPEGGSWHSLIIDMDSAGDYSPNTGRPTMTRNAFELSFSPEFFFAEGEPYDGGPDVPTRRPISVWSAIESLRLGDPERWATMAQEVFGVDPQYLTPETVLEKVQETNTCGTLSSPVDVYIDPEGYFTVRVYDDVRSDDYESNRGRMRKNTRPKMFELWMPTFDWRQIGGDINPGAHGGLIALADGNQIDLIEIQPVREFVGDGEAADVGFPFWTKEASYDLDDLSANKKQVQRAMDYFGIDDDALAEMRPEQRTLAIAEALMRYGYAVEEGPAGWSEDIVPFPVEWWGGTTATFAEYCGDEDDEFRRDVLEEDEED